MPISHYFPHTNLHYYLNLIKTYPIISLEDPFEQDDFEAFKELSKKSIGKTAIARNSIILIKTWTKPMKKFDFGFTFLEKTGAAYLAKKGVRAVGIDQLGIERGQPGHETHGILFRKGIAVFEGLELSSIRQGSYFFIGLPLKIKDGDGAPARCVLVEGFGK